MLLNEAIRLGSTLGPQLFGQSVQGHASCALGAAALALGYVPGSRIPFDLYEYFPALKGKRTTNGQPVIDAIVSLNDQWMIPRVEIADWIVRNGYDCESVPVPAVEVNAWKEEVEACV